MRITRFLCYFYYKKPKNNENKTNYFQSLRLAFYKSTFWLASLKKHRVPLSSEKTRFVDSSLALTLLLRYCKPIAIAIMIKIVPRTKKNPCILIWNLAHFAHSIRATPKTPIKLADTGVKASINPAPN